jgi:hypothetical protein
VAGIHKQRLLDLNREMERSPVAGESINRSDGEGADLEGVGRKAVMHRGRPDLGIAATLTCLKLLAAGAVPDGERLIDDTADVLAAADRSDALFAACRHAGHYSEEKAQYERDESSIVHGCRRVARARRS